ncbi:MAG: nucleotidyltransferase domain-containing protein [Thermoguttaceae bacterium]|jgi:predicted nucleotidyltransferase
MVQIQIPQESLASFCRRNHIRKLSLFGSVLRKDFRPDSDVDVLVLFEPGHVVGMRIIEMEQELSTILGGHKVDIINEKYINPRLRNQVMKSAEVQYAQG